MAGALDILSGGNEDPDSNIGSVFSPGGALSTVPNEAYGAVSERSAAASRAMQRLQALRYANMDIPMLGLAAGFLSPTKTGSFGESMGNAAQGLMGGVGEQWKNIGSLEAAEHGRLENELLGYTTRGVRQMYGEGPGGFMIPGQGGAQPVQGGFTGEDNYTVPPMFNIASMAQQAQIMMRIPNPAFQRTAQAMLSLIEKGLGEKVYFGQDGGIHAYPGAALSVAELEYAKEAAATVAKNLGNVTIPSSGGFAPGPTSIGPIGPGVLSGGVQRPGATTGPAARPAPGPGYTGSPPSPGPAPGAAPPGPSTATRPTVGGVSRPAPGGLPPGGAAPSAAAQGLPSGPTTSTVGGRQVITMPSPEAKTISEMGGYPEEAKGIGAEMAKWYSQMQNSYIASPGVYQNLDNAFKALQQFKSGASANYQAETARWLKALGVDPAQLKLADPAAVQTLNKAVTQMVFSAIRQVSTRPAYQEFLMLQQANPNQDLDPEANMKIISALLAKQNWERDMFKTVNQWRRQNRGHSLDDFDLVGYMDSHPIPKYEDDALYDLIQRGGVNGVTDAGRWFNDPQRGAAQGKVPQPGETGTVPNEAGGKDFIVRGADHKWHLNTADGPLYNK